MAKTDATKRSKRQSKVVKVSEGQNEAKEDNPTERTGVEVQQEEDQDEQDSQMNIEVKGNTPTVTVSWDEKKKEEGEGDDTEQMTDANDQMTGSEQSQIISSADAAVCPTEEAPSHIAETEVDQEMEECGVKLESQMETAPQENESTPAVTRKRRKNKTEKENNENKKTAVKGKRKADPADETSPSKKTKLVSDVAGFRLFVGNLNTSKPFAELKDSLANYLVTQSLLFDDIQLDRSKKHAFVNLASEMDLTKALALDGETVFDRPLKMAKAKDKSEEKVKVKPPPLDKKAKDARCLFLKNLPYNATKKDIMKIFRKAIAIRFPGGAEGPSHGIAFVEFKNKKIATKVRERKQGARIRGRLLIVDCVGERNVSEVTKADADSKSKKAAPPPSNTLFVSNLSSNVNEKNLKSVFQNAVSISIPERQSKPKRFAFVEFATVADAEKVLKSPKKIKVGKREATVQFCMKAKADKPEVLSKTLIVMGLAEKTTAETLRGAFEGSVDARVAVDKETGLSKRFGFVEFESDENCKAVKEAMEDCEIDGSKVTVAYARAKSEKGRQGARGGSTGRPSGQSAAPGAPKEGRGGKEKSLKGGKKSKKGKGQGAATPQDAPKKVKKRKE
ncbi:nucleolin-like isoform X2 [Acanthochromis polyacanthus]|uniref:nucleolin-like isoform X2 n=1 Tax=Acanthochromis polyacanthus TaxID=80966 RepID=UPI00223411A2|nr:nucleolin-like isoform X2 [Acanthochromis polyacanthus]